MLENPAEATSKNSGLAVDQGDSSADVGRRIKTAGNRKMDAFLLRDSGWHEPDHERRKLLPL